MEGPSLVISVEELSRFFRKKVTESTTPASLKGLTGRTFKGARSWGKHLILEFTGCILRIHFLMFGSYRINQPRENRIPKLELGFKADRVYFYSCAIKEITAELVESYDFRTDLMSDAWEEKRVLTLLKPKQEKLVCDVLMDQEIFSGLGNIMKNEILFRRRLHPETVLGALRGPEQKRLVRDCRKYSFQFYEWKKANVLKRNWLIMRKKACPACGGKVVKKPTGVLKRLSHFCPKCQKKRLNQE